MTQEVVHQQQAFERTPITSGVWLPIALYVG